MNSTFPANTIPTSDVVMLPESIWDQSPLPAVRISNQKKIVAGNPAMLSLITNSKAFYQGKPLLSWLGLTNMELLLEWSEAFLKGDQPNHLRLEVKDISTPLFLIEAIPVGSDLVIRSLPYQEENTAEVESERTIRFFQELRRSISHDLRAPVRQLRLYTQKILNYSKTPVSKELREEMVFLNESSGELLQRFESLSLLVKNESRPLESSAVEVSHLVNLASSAFSLHLKETNGEIIIGELPVVIADQELLLGIITETLNNAMDHIPTDREPRISITARKSETGIDLLFSDNGIGFDNKAAAYLFAAYSAVHHSPKVGQSGPGMGLTIARRAAEKMGMALTASGEKGQGATFVLEIPQHLILD